jgi:hypothetical protein
VVVGPSACDVGNNLVPAYWAQYRRGPAEPKLSRVTNHHHSFSLPRRWPSPPQTTQPIRASLALLFSHSLLLAFFKRVLVWPTT